MLCTKGSTGAITTTIGCYGCPCVRVQHYYHARDDSFPELVRREYITSMAVVLHLAAIGPTLLASN